MSTIPLAEQWAKTLLSTYKASLLQLDCEKWLAFRAYLDTGNPDQFSMGCVFKIIPDHWYNQPSPTIESYLGATERPPTGTSCDLLGHYAFFVGLPYERDTGNYFKFETGYTMIHTDQPYTSYTPLAQHFSAYFNVPLPFVNWLWFAESIPDYIEEIPVKTILRLMDKITDLALGLQKRNGDRVAPAIASCGDE